MHFSALSEVADVAGPWLGNLDLVSRQPILQAIASKKVKAIPKVGGHSFS